MISRFDKAAADHNPRWWLGCVPVDRHQHRFRREILAPMIAAAEAENGEAETVALAIPHAARAGVAADRLGPRLARAEADPICLKSRSPL
jgi:hypothetical protein